MATSPAKAEADKVVRARALQKRYGSSSAERIVFQDVSLELRAGERVAVFGANGSGKSTLLRMLAGITPPDGGELHVSRAVANSIGYVFQDYEQSLMPWLSCEDNISLPLVSAGSISHEVARQRVREFAAELQLDLPLGNYAYQMSGGQQQLTSFARALITEPMLLLLDEPFASLDYLNRMSMLRALDRDWARRPKTIVLVTHDVDEAILASDRVLVLGGRPSTIVELIDVPVPRPRAPAAISTPEFGDVRARVLAHFPEQLG